MTLSSKDVFEIALSLYSLSSGLAPIIEPTDILNKKPELEEISFLKKENANLKEQIQTLNQKIELIQNSKNDLRTPNACFRHKIRHEKCPANCQGREGDKKRKQKRKPDDKDDEEEFKGSF